MKRQNRVFSVLLAAVIISMAALSAYPGAGPPGTLMPAAEAQVTGGMSCATGAGIAVGLALGAFSPCSFVCALLDWDTAGALWLAGC